MINTMYHTTLYASGDRMYVVEQLIVNGIWERATTLVRLKRIRSNHVPRVAGSWQHRYGTRHTTYDHASMIPPASACTNHSHVLCCLPASTRVSFFYSFVLRCTFCISFPRRPRSH